MADKADKAAAAFGPSSAASPQSGAPARKSCHERSSRSRPL
jgi:hypothetical protein